ncbi:putative ferric-chelate reductase 1 [Orchesella cincta]|uniref:Putative ferric-chelate reductase 1 n=1 Tax=Orchesella cincta TaxID=48709 RepID=A0A1D2MVB2_ORCCI|nr:putative ferric-chelate reductase 1 [Orchesella cincta]
MKNLNQVCRMGKVRRTLPIVLAFTLVHAISTVNGFGGGAPNGVCKTMLPGHGSSPQTGPNPYKVEISKSSLMGQEVMDITISSKTGSDDFVGFLLQVRKPGDNNKAYGSFNEVIENDLGQTLECFDIANSGVTHKNNKPKKSITVQWTAPNDEDAEYEILYSVVKSYNEYWTHHTHEQKLVVKRDPNAAAPPAGGLISASDELLKRWREVYGGCGDNKGCFGMPNKCIENFDASSDNPTVCKMMVTWEKKGSENRYQLTANMRSQNGYVAVGFSDDDKMGKDSVVGCGGSGQTPTIMRYINPSSYDPNEVHKAAPKLGIEDIDKAYTDGNLFCSFRQDNHKINDIEFDVDKPHYLLLAIGSSHSDGGLHQHSDKGPSPQTIVITDNIIIGASPNTWLVQLHGGLMVIAWLLCASTGMFVARYYKQTHVEVMPCGKAFWFSLHVFCMASTAFLTICGSIIILIKKKGLYFTDVHQYLGVIVVGLAICQVFIAFLRPHPNTPKRPLFNWVHWGIGNSAHIVGITCIGFAVELSLADLKRFGNDENTWVWILLGLVLFHVLMHVIMSVHTLWSDKQMSEGQNKKRAMVPGPMKPSGASSEAPGTVFRDFMLGLYLLIMAAGAITLVALIAWPKKKEEDPTA